MSVADRISQFFSSVRTRLSAIFCCKKPANTPEPSLDECSIDLPDVPDYTANNNVFPNRGYDSDEENPFEGEKNQFHTI